MKTPQELQAMSIDELVKITDKMRADSDKAFLLAREKLTKSQLYDRMRLEQRTVFAESLLRERLIFDIQVV